MDDKKTFKTRFYEVVWRENLHLFTNDQFDSLKALNIPALNVILGNELVVTREGIASVYE